MVQVKISEGILEGVIVESEYGNPYYSFKGIPYAEPPTGDLRFQAPQPLKPWNGVRSVKHHGPVCPQQDIVFKTNEVFNEDCLYINVYTPDIAPETLIPVMVWIHGGGYFCGSGNDSYYGPEFLVNHDVVVVTFNYRLGVFGFLCLDTEEIPGNAGFKDQVAALRWVKRNITQFGGDFENITLFGQSAGSACVAYHLISPMSKGLFKRAILQSGVSTNSWSIMHNMRDRAITLARKLGCHSEDDKVIAAFLKALPAESLVARNIAITIAEAQNELPEIHYGATPEKKFGAAERFFTEEDTRYHIHEGVDIIVGYTEHEGLLLVNIIQNMDRVVKQANIFLEYYIPKPFHVNCSIYKQLELGKEVKNFYLRQDDISITNFEPFLKYFAFAFFVYDIIKWTKTVSTGHKNKIFFFKFTCKSKLNKFGEIYSEYHRSNSSQFVSHCDDLAYLFKWKNSTIYSNSKEYKMIQRMTKLWTNFAKYGHPTPDMNLGVTWPEFNAEEQMYLNIGNELIVEHHPDKEEFEFWENNYKKYLPNLTY